VDVDAGFISYGWKGGCLNIVAGWGPELSKLDAGISAEIWPNGRKEQVRIKVANNKRCNLRIAVFRSNDGQRFVANLHRRISLNVVFQIGSIVAGDPDSPIAAGKQIGSQEIYLMRGDSPHATRRKLDPA
jgi:hypothetical protein